MRTIKDFCVPLPAGVDTSGFEKNPVILFGSILNDPIGRAENLEVNPGRASDGHLRFDAVFTDEGERLLGAIPLPAAELVIMNSKPPQLVAISFWVPAKSRP